jgi:hypothetical protein
MNKITTLGIAAVGLMGFACSVDMGEPQEEVASSENTISCDNNLATFSVLAGMAVASANEMRRWLPQRDMECEGTNVGTDANADGTVDQPGKCIRWAPNFKMGLSKWAWPRCPNRNCRYTAGLLKLQDGALDGHIFGGQPLDSGVLKSRLASYWDRQFVCINRPDNGTGDDCPVEYHDLSFWYKTTSSVTCNGGYDYWFHSSKQNSNPPVPLSKPGQLKNMLIWAGGSDNPFLMFNNVNGDVKIDPTGGTAEGSSTTSGSCTIVNYNSNLNRCGTVQSATPLTGQCCTCNGVNKTFVWTSGDYYACR